MQTLTQSKIISPIIHKLYICWLNQFIYSLWILKGRPSPPPHIVKQKNILRYASLYNISILIETGTYQGDMIKAIKDHFQCIHSIELNDLLHHNAKEKFKELDHIHIHHGNSGEILSSIIHNINNPAIFWLDGHYSGTNTSRAKTDTPVIEELKQIFQVSQHNHAILIDDARCFNGTNDYPHIAEIEHIVKTNYPTAKLTIKDDCIFILPA